MMPSNPLVQDGKKLIPSVTRVFATGREIYVYFQAYKQTPTSCATPSHLSNRSSHSLASTRAGRNCTRRRRSRSFPAPTSRLGTMTLSFDLGVDNLPRGQYDCQVTILDPSTQKAAFWRAPILLVSQ